MPYRILVADDDDGFRFPVVNLFRDYGYEVLEAVDRNGVMEEAPKCDIWFVDVRLPTGQQEGILAVYDLVKSRKQVPRYPVIFISVLEASFAAGNLRKLDDLQVRYEWIQKPCELELLLEHVRDILSEESPDAE
ncbi:MAG: response regulator [Phycisphaerae bacterium]|jgi:DNA-binding NtrC family response regulator